MKITKMELEKLKPYEKNPRINAEAVPQVAKSIQEFGFQQPIVVDKDYTIIVGHTRYLAAKSLELKFVPVVIASDLSPEKVKAYRLMDNRTHERSEWDLDLLLNEINDLSEFYDAEFLDFANLENDSLEPSDENKYTTKIEVPIYEPGKIKPNIDELIDLEKYTSLHSEISSLDILDDLKKFLLISAGRHIVFKYDKIADYYSHTNDTKVKEIMEKLALVIIDYNKAIEYGFVKMSETIAEDIDD